MRSARLIVAMIAMSIASGCGSSGPSTGGNLQTCPPAEFVPTSQSEPSGVTWWQVSSDFRNLPDEVWVTTETYRSSTVTVAKLQWEKLTAFGDSHDYDEKLVGYDTSGKELWTIHADDYFVVALDESTLVLYRYEWASCGGDDRRVAYLIAADPGTGSPRWTKAVPFTGTELLAVSLGRVWLRSTLSGQAALYAWDEQTGAAQP